MLPQQYNLLWAANYFTNKTLQPTGVAAAVFNSPITIHHVYQVPTLLIFKLVDLKVLLHIELSFICYTLSLARFYPKIKASH